MGWTKHEDAVEEVRRQYGRAQAALQAAVTEFKSVGGRSLRASSIQALPEAAYNYLRLSHMAGRHPDRGMVNLALGIFLTVNPKLCWRRR